MQTEEWISFLGRDVEAGRFVPFIGAGVSAFRDPEVISNLLSSDNKDFEMLRAAPGALSAYRFGRLKSYSASDSEKHLLDIIADINYLSEARRETVSWCGIYTNWANSSEAIAFDESPLEVLLIQLQKNILKFLVYLDTVAADQTRNSNTLTAWLPNTRLLIPERSIGEAVSILNDCLSNATKIRKFLKDTNVEICFLLCPESIETALRDLASKIVRGEIDLFSPEHVEIFDSVNKRAYSDSQLSFLGDEIQWLFSFLWHLFRFDDPLLPSSRELTLRLTLRKTGKPIRVVGELSQVAEALAVVDGEQEMFPQHVSEVIDNWISYCHRITKDLFPVSSGYKSLASVTKAMYQANERRIKDNPCEPKIPPLLFTTNYDESLEIALMNVENPPWGAIHILFPVYREIHFDGDSSSKAQDLDGKISTSSQYSSQDSASGIETAWVRQTIINSVHRLEPSIICKDRSENSDTQSGGQSQSHCLKNILNDKSIPGPIILKLHGAPSVDIASISEQIPQQSPFSSVRWNHMTLITESGYVQVLSEATSREMPLAALQTVRSRFGLWFLGYSLSDWNIRSQLYFQVATGKNETPSLGQNDKRNGHRYAVMQSKDEVKHAYCENLNIKPALTDDLYMFFRSLSYLTRR